MYVRWAGAAEFVGSHAVAHFWHPVHEAILAALPAAPAPFEPARNVITPRATSGKRSLPRGYSVTSDLAGMVTRCALEAPVIDANLLLAVTERCEVFREHPTVARAS